MPPPEILREHTDPRIRPQRSDALFTTSRGVTGVRRGLDRTGVPDWFDHTRRDRGARPLIVAESP